jgi:hypothetical protein
VNAVGDLTPHTETESPEKTMPWIRLLPFLLCYSVAVGQPSSQLMQEANFCYEKKDFSKCADRYVAASKLDTNNVVAYYGAACCYALGGARPLAYEYIHKAIRHGWRDVAWLKQDSDFVSLRNEKEWQQLLTGLQTLVDEEEKRMNKPYRDELLLMEEDDQKYRQMMDSVRAKYGWNSQEMKSLSGIILETDSTNLLRLERLVMKYSWPTRVSVGSRACMAAFLIIQHSPLPVQERYFPVIEAATKQGDIEPSAFALLVDRIRMRKGEKQLYGSQIVQNGKGEYEIYPIEDEINVDARRRDMGLGPLEEYVKRWNINYVPKKP